MSSTPGTPTKQRRLSDPEDAPLGLPGPLSNFTAFRETSGSGSDFSSIPSRGRSLSTTGKLDSSTPEIGKSVSSLGTNSSSKRKRTKEEKKMDKDLKKTQKELKKEEKKRKKSYKSSSRRGSEIPGEAAIDYEDSQGSSLPSSRFAATAVFTVPDANTLLQGSNNNSSTENTNQQKAEKATEEKDERFNSEFAKYLKGIIDCDFLKKANNTNPAKLLFLTDSLECDYIILLDTATHIKKYLLKLLLILTNKKIPVATAVTTTPFSPRNLDTDFSKEPEKVERKPTPPPSTVIDYCFNVEVCIVKNDNVSVHLTVPPEMRLSFYHHYSRYYNNKFTKFAVDPLFPTLDNNNLTNSSSASGAGEDFLNDAQKKRIFNYVLREMIYDDYYIFHNSVGSLNMNNTKILSPREGDIPENNSMASSQTASTAVLNAALQKHNNVVIKVLNEINALQEQLEEEEAKEREMMDNVEESLKFKDKEIDIQEFEMFPSHVDHMRDFIWESAITHLRRLIFILVRNYYSVKLLIEERRSKKPFTEEERRKMNEKINEKLRQRRAKNLKTLKKTVRIDENMIFDYFGEEITFYFAFMNHYSKCLGIGALFSLAYLVFTCLRSLYQHYNPPPTSGVDGNAHRSSDIGPLLVFSTCILLGTVLFIKFWERRLSYLHLKYHLFIQNDGNGDGAVSGNKIELRKEFKADTIVKNPVTNAYEKYYPAWKRELIIQPFSWCVLLLFVAFSFFCMILCLNMEGLVVRSTPHGPLPQQHANSTVAPTITVKQPRLHIPALHRLSEEGHIFNKKNHVLLAYLPKVLYSVVIQLCSRLFQVVATALNNLENYEYMSEYNKNFTMKRVFFEFFNSFGKLFFILFVRRDIDELKSNVTFIFLFSVFIRLITCTLIPFLNTHMGVILVKYKHNVLSFLHKLRILKAPPAVEDPRTKQRHSTTKEKEKNEEERGRHGGNWDIHQTPSRKGAAANHLATNRNFSALDQLDEYLAPDYEVYDDMIEMIIQLGYVLFFIPLFPVYSIVCVFLSNFLEVRSDLFKLCYVARRSPNTRFGTAENIVYIYVLRTFVLVAVLMNMFLFLLMMEKEEAPEMNTITNQYERILYAIYGEHLLIVVILFLLWRIPSVPGGVRDYLRERYYSRWMGIQYKAPKVSSLVDIKKKEL